MSFKGAAGLQSVCVCVCPSVAVFWLPFQPNNPDSDNDVCRASDWSETLSGSSRASGNIQRGDTGSDLSFSR